MNINRIIRAQDYCRAAHLAVGQVRKYTGEPYHWHPYEVAAILQEHVKDLTEDMLIAALLHDVVEDTAVPLGDIDATFGPSVARLVSDLTDVSKPEDGNRAARKAIDREHTARASHQAKTIKLADLIDNSRSILDRDPEFAKVYLEEKRLLLDVLKEGDPILWEIAAGLVAWPPT